MKWSWSGDDEEKMVPEEETVSVTMSKSLKCPRHGKEASVPGVMLMRRLVRVEIQYVG